MNNLLTREFHEVIGKVIPVEMNEDIRLGNALLDRIPTTIVQDLQEEEEEEVECECIDARELYNQLRFNVGETKVNLIENILIQNKDYWSLYDLYLETPPWNKLPKLSLYTYVRRLVNKPLIKTEYEKINNDIKSIKKSMKALKKKKYKKTEGKYSINF